MSDECKSCGDQTIDCECHFPKCPICQNIIYRRDGLCMRCEIEKARELIQRTNETISLGEDLETPPPEKIPVRYIDVCGREEHEALLKDTKKMLELGLDPWYEKTMYLKRWGKYLNE